MSSAERVEGRTNVRKIASLLTGVRCRGRVGLVTDLSAILEQIDAAAEDLAERAAKRKPRDARWFYNIVARKQLRYRVLARNARRHGGM
jgi:hypothetical protein